MLYKENDLTDHHNIFYTVIMLDISFEWDEKKHSLNKRKHGTSFVEAQTVFADENGLILHDQDHSHEEDMYMIAIYYSYDI